MDYFSKPRHLSRKPFAFLRYFLSISANLHECLVHANGPAANGFDLLNGPGHDVDLGGEVRAKELVPTTDMDFVPEKLNYKSVFKKVTFDFSDFSVTFLKEITKITWKWLFTNE